MIFENSAVTINKNRDYSTNINTTKILTLTVHITVKFRLENVEMAYSIALCSNFLMKRRVTRKPLMKPNFHQYPFINTTLTLSINNRKSKTVNDARQKYVELRLRKQHQVV